jgi:glycosyltransferase involved in cell wall biosynthesis
MIEISVIIEMFTGQIESDVTVEEAFGSLGTQDYPPEHVELLIVTDADTPDVRRLVAKSFGRFAGRVRVIATGSRDYHRAKLRGIQEASGRAIAFVDSDTIEPPGWLGCVHEQLLDRGHAAVAGPTAFKPGIGRLEILVADFGMLSEDGLEWAPFFHFNNVAFRREVLLSLKLDDRGAFNRFGGARFLLRQMHRRGLGIRLDPRMRSTHGFSWRVNLCEKRLRRLVHLAYVRRHDPDSGLSRIVGVPERPLSWLWPWAASAWRYQRQPGLCRKTLGIGAARRLSTRALLAGLSVYELGLIFYFTVVPGALRRLAQKYVWWPEGGEGRGSRLPAATAPRIPHGTGRR